MPVRARPCAIRGAMLVAIQGVARTHGVSVESALVTYFKGNRQKALLSKVYARACGGMQVVAQTVATKAQLRRIHSPLKLLNLILEMGSTKMGYRNLVTFCPSPLINFVPTPPKGRRYGTVSGPPGQRISTA